MVSDMLIAEMAAGRGDGLPEGDAGRPRTSGRRSSPAARAAGRTGSRAPPCAARCASGCRRSCPTPPRGAAALGERGAGRTARRTPRAAGRARPPPRSAGRSVSICLAMYCDETSVSRGMPPPISTTEPYSPIARANARPAPLSSAGISAGSTMRRKIVQLPAPSDAAACSASRSASISTGCTERTTNGRVTNSSAIDDRRLRRDQVQADRAARPVEREQHDAGHDRRQREREVDEGVDDPLAAGTRRARAPRRSACPTDDVDERDDGRGEHGEAAAPPGPRAP